MSGIDIFSWIVLLVIILSVIAVFVVLGMLPGKVAQQRQHPQVQAISIASWLALIFGVAAWPFVMVWAYLRPVARPLDQSELSPVKQNTQLEAALMRIDELEQRVNVLETAPEQGGEK